MTSVPNHLYEDGNTTGCQKKQTKSILKNRENMTMPNPSLSLRHFDTASRLSNRRVSFANKVKLHKIDFVPLHESESDKVLSENELQDSSSEDDESSNISLSALEKDASSFVEQMRSSTADYSSDDEDLPKNDNFSSHSADDDKTMDLTALIRQRQEQDMEFTEPLNGDQKAGLSYPLTTDHHHYLHEHVHQRLDQGADGDLELTMEFTKNVSNYSVVSHSSTQNGFKLEAQGSIPQGQRLDFDGEGNEELTMDFTKFFNEASRHDAFLFAGAETPPVGNAHLASLDKHTEDNATMEFTHPFTITQNTKQEEGQTSKDTDDNQDNNKETGGMQQEETNDAEVVDRKAKVADRTLEGEDQTDERGVEYSVVNNISGNEIDADVQHKATSQDEQLKDAEERCEETMELTEQVTTTGSHKEDQEETMELTALVAPTGPYKEDEEESMEFTAQVTATKTKEPEQEAKDDVTPDYDTHTTPPILESPRSEDARSATSPSKLERDSEFSSRLTAEQNPENTPASTNLENEVVEPQSVDKILHHNVEDNEKFDHPTDDQDEPANEDLKRQSEAFEAEAVSESISKLDESKESEKEVLSDINEAMPAPSQEDAASENNVHSQPMELTQPRSEIKDVSNMSSPPAKRNSEGLDEPPQKQLKNSIYTTTLDIPLAETSTLSVDGVDDDIDEPNYQPVELSTFLHDIGVKFYDDLEIATDSANRFSLHDDLLDVSMEDYYKCNVHLPLLEVYEMSCKELSQKIQQGKALYQEISERTFNDNPMLFKQYYCASYYDQVSLKAEFHRLKEFTRHQAKQVWYQWRTQLMRNVLEVQQGNLEILQADKKVLEEAITEIEDQKNRFQEDLQRLRRDITSFKEIKASYKELDSAQIKNIKLQLLKLNQTLLNHRDEITKKEEELVRVNEDIKNIDLSIQIQRDELRKAESRLSRRRHFSDKEIRELESEVKALEKRVGLQYLSEVDLDVVEFACNPYILATITFKDGVPASIRFSRRDHGQESSTVTQKGLVFEDLSSLAFCHLPKTEIKPEENIAEFRRIWNKIKQIDHDLYRVSLKYPSIVKVNDESLTVSTTIYSFKTGTETIYTLVLDAEDLTKYPENLMVTATRGRRLMTNGVEVPAFKGLSKGLLAKLETPIYEL